MSGGLLKNVWRIVLLGALASVLMAVRRLWQLLHPDPQWVDFFAYSDSDLNGTPSGDTAFPPLPVHVVYTEGRP